MSLEIKQVQVFVVVIDKNSLEDDDRAILDSCLINGITYKVFDESELALMLEQTEPEFVISSLLPYPYIGMLAGYYGCKYIYVNGENPDSYGTEGLLESVNLTYGTVISMFEDNWKETLSNKLKSKVSLANIAATMEG